MECNCAVTFGADDYRAPVQVLVKAIIKPIKFTLEYKVVIKSSYSSNG